MAASSTPSPGGSSGAGERAWWQNREGKVLYGLALRRENARRRSERLAAARAIATHTAAEWNALATRYSGRCVRCGTSEYRVEKDHIVPLFLGGSDGIANIQPLCARCNSSKGPERIDWRLYRDIHGFESQP
jgi:5-methylcytosine-specific restriction endonuclease McrA